MKPRVVCFRYRSKESKVLEVERGSSSHASMKQLALKRKINAGTLTKLIKHPFLKRITLLKQLWVLLKHAMKRQKNFLDPQPSKGSRLKKILNWKHKTLVGKRRKDLGRQSLGSRAQPTREKQWSREAHPKREWNLLDGTLVRPEVGEPDSRLLCDFTML